MIDFIYLVILFAASVIDVRKRYVYNITHIAVISLFIADVGFNKELIIRIISALIITIPILILTLKKDFIGGGDIKFIFCNTLMNGFIKSINGIILGCLLMVVYYFINKNNNKKPMLPFLSIGFFIFRRI